MPGRKPRSISLPIVLSSVSVALSVGLLVAWIYVILRHLSQTRQVVHNSWLLVGGVVSLATIITVLVLFSVFLAREILEVRRQTSFIDSVTHELRSPLASLRLCVETLDRPELSEAQRTELRRMMLEDLARLTAFIDDVLHASRLAYGGGLRAVQEVDVAALLGSCAQAICRRYHNPPEEIEIDVMADLQIRTDPAALEVVVKNLIDNAVKYSDAPRKIRIRARQQPPSKIVIEVQDSGVGIAKRDLRRIFERFFRVPEENVRKRHGTGMGLFVASALVRGLGGKIRAESPGPNLGTTFRVTLPAFAAL